MILAGDWFINVRLKANAYKSCLLEHSFSELQPFFEIPKIPISRCKYIFKTFCAKKKNTSSIKWEFGHYKV